MRQDHRVGRRREPVHALLDGDEQAARRERRLARSADDAAQENVALAIDLLGVQDGHVWGDRRYGAQRRAGKRTGNARQAAAARPV